MVDFMMAIWLYGFMVIWLCAYDGYDYAFNAFNAYDVNDGYDDYAFDAYDAYDVNDGYGCL